MHQRSGPKVAFFGDSFVRLFGLIDKPTLAFKPERGGDPLIERRPVWFDEGWVDCPVYDRAALQIGHELEGPAILEEAGGTSIVPPGWTVRVHPSGSLDCRLPVGD